MEGGYLPKRDELSLRTVFALPNDSRSGLHSITCTRKGRRRVVAHMVGG